MLVKTLPAQIQLAKDDSGDPEGTFEAIVSTYGVDSIGDRVIPGAFSDTLTAWKDSGSPIPVIWSHQHSDPFSHVGELSQAEERADEGLYVKGLLDLENPTAKQVYKLLKGKRVSQFSFAYDVEDAAENDEGGLDLKALKLFEVGPTLIGMNQETHTLAVKNGAKVGRSLSAKNEKSLRDAVELLTGVLASLGDGESSGTSQQKASTSGPAKDEEPNGAKSEEPSHGVSVDALAAQIGILERSAPR